MSNIDKVIKNGKMVITGIRCIGVSMLAYVVVRSIIEED